MEFAANLRRKAASAGHAVLLSTFHRLVSACEPVAESGVWETRVGPFEGLWHLDQCNHVILAVHLASQHLRLAHVDVDHQKKSVVYVVSWADEPDYERMQAQKKRHVRPRLPDDPLLADFEERKHRAEEKRRAIAESEEYKIFLASRPAPLTGAKAEREALRESRKKWKEMKQNLTLEAKRTVTPMPYPHPQWTANLAPIPSARPAAAIASSSDLSSRDVVVAVGPKKFLTKAEFLREKNAILDSDFEERAKRNAELLKLSKPGDLSGPLREPGIKSIPVDLSDGQRSLCRCGQSAHYPFCDMTHVQVNLRLGTTFGPYRANAEVVGQDLLLVCGCGESTKTLDGGIKVCDGTTCQNLPVALKLKELQDTPAEPEPLSVGLQRTSQVYERAEEHKRNALGSLRTSLRAQDLSEREFETECDEFKEFVKFSTKRLEMQHIDFPASDHQVAKRAFQADSELVLAEMDAKIKSLEKKAARAARNGADLDDELQRVRKLRLAFNTSVADMEAEIEDNLVSESKQHHDQQERSNVRASHENEEDVLDRFDTMVKEYVTFARDTAARIERTYLEEAETTIEPAQEMLNKWLIDYREIDRQSTTRFDDLEAIVHSNDASKHEFDSMLKFASGARIKLNASVKEVEEELKAKVKEELARLEHSSQSMGDNNSSLNNTTATATFDSDEEEREALRKEEEERAEQKRLADELAAFKRAEEEEVLRKQAEILENQRQLEEWLREKKEAEELAKRVEQEEREREAENAKREQEEKEKRETLEREKREQEERERREQEEREKREKEEREIREQEERERRLQEEKEREQEERERREQEEREKREQEERDRREQEEREKREQEEREKRLQKEKEKQEQEEKEARLREEKEKEERQEAAREQRAQEVAAQLERERLLRVEEQKKQQQQQTKTPITMLDLERRVAEAERKREEKKLAAKSPRRPAPPKEDSAQVEMLQRSQLQREQAERAAAQAQFGVQSLEKGDVERGLKNTRDIDLNTPEVKRKKESVPSRDTESPVAGSAPGQEEVLSAPAVLRANYSGRTWSQMAVAKTPFCVRLLDMAKRRLDEPACKWKDTQGDWIAVSWSKLAQLVERIAKGLIAVGIKRGDRVLLLAETRHEWGAVCLATQMVGAVVVTAFSSASAESLVSVVQEQLPASLITDDSSQWAKLRASGSRLSPIKTVVTLPGSAKLDETRALTWDAFLARGSDVRSARVDGRISQITPNDTAMISYSERSSRAVVLSHANEMFAADSFTRAYQMDASDRLLSFMPLANPAERVLAIYQAINSGSLVYYGDSLANLHDNIAAVQPTVIFSAPVLWERFAAAIKAKLGSKEPNELASSVQKKLKKFIGCSRLRLGLTSMVDIRPDTLTFYRALQLPVRSVYCKAGLSGIATFNDGSNSDSMGIPFEGVSFSVAPSGELSVKGPCVCVANYGAAPNNSEIRTGDVVRITADKSVHFVGRLDRQKKIGQTNVQLDAVELLLCSHPMVANSFTCVKDERVVALLTLNAQIASNNALKNNIGLTEYIQSKECTALISDHVASVNKKLPVPSRVQAYRILPKEFSVKEGEVTSHALLVPQVIEKKYRQVIDQL